jgi:uncharacterized coiled-coil DUF342 family protein
MSHAEDRNTSKLDAETKQLEGHVRQLVLMKETGPKSAAWHRARVQTIWRLHRKLEQVRRGSANQGFPHDDQKHDV